MRKTLLCTTGRCGSHIIRYSIASVTDCQMLITVNNVGKDINPDGREILYLERKNSYKWALTNLYNTFIFSKINYKDDNIWRLEDREDYYQQQLAVFKEPITLTYWHFKPLIEKIKQHNKIKKNFPSKSPTLFYEDICADPTNELAKWDIEFLKEKASIQIKKIPHEEAFTNSAYFSKFWNDNLQ